MQELNGLAMTYNDLVAEEEKATEAYKNQADALAEANEKVAGYQKTIDEMEGEVEQATDAQKEWLESIGKICFYNKRKRC